MHLSEGDDNLIWSWNPSRKKAVSMGYKASFLTANQEKCWRWDTPWHVKSPSNPGYFPDLKKVSWQGPNMHTLCQNCTFAQEISKKLLVLARRSGNWEEELLVDSYRSYKSNFVDDHKALPWIIPCALWTARNRILYQYKYYSPLNIFAASNTYMLISNSPKETESCDTIQLINVFPWSSWSQGTIPFRSVYNQDLS